MEASHSTSIHNLHDEHFLVIAQFLSSKDIDVCLNVCQQWRRAFNSNSIWRGRCFYQEKYFKSVPELRSELLANKISLESTVWKPCVWKQCYEHEQRVCDNWSKGNYEVENTRIAVSDDPIDSCIYVDEDGNRWFFENSLNNSIKIWNTSATPVESPRCIDTTYETVMRIVGDKLITHNSSHVKVFLIKYPGNVVKMLYEFLFYKDSILQDDTEIPILTYEDKFIAADIVIDNFFIGYNKQISDIYTVNLHIWDLDCAKKIATKNAFQQSYIDYILSETNNEVTTDFSGEVELFVVEPGKFIVSLWSDRHDKSQVSLFDLRIMKFTNVIARVNGKVVLCHYEDYGFVVINHSGALFLAIYMNGEFVTALEISTINIPLISNSHVITQLGTAVRVMKYYSANSFDTTFQIRDDQSILAFIYPTFLLVHKQIMSFEGEFSEVSCWDIKSASELWRLDSLVDMKQSSTLLSSIKYPGKLMVVFKGDDKLSILNFEKCADQNN